MQIRGKLNEQSLLESNRTSEDDGENLTKIIQMRLYKPMYEILPLLAIAVFQILSHKRYQVTNGT